MTSYRFKLDLAALFVVPALWFAKWFAIGLWFALKWSCIGLYYLLVALCWACVEGGRAVRRWRAAR
jgi:hypothetical protein